MNGSSCDARIGRCYPCAASDQAGARTPTKEHRWISREFLGGINTGRPAHLPVLHGVLRARVRPGHDPAADRHRLDPVLVPLRGERRRAARQLPRRATGRSSRKEYSAMIGFVTVFLASSIAFARRGPGALQDRSRCSRRRASSTSSIGGILGLARGRASSSGASSSSSTRSSASRASRPMPQELEFLRHFWEPSIRRRPPTSFRETVIPAFFALTGFLVPDWIEPFFPR